MPQLAKKELVGFLFKFIFRCRIGLSLIYCGIKWLFANNHSQLIRVVGRLQDNNKPIRAILLWSPNCDFSKSDRNLVSWASQDFSGEVILIINCDCPDHKNEKTPEEFLMHTILIRKNIGYDWGGYRDLFLYVETSNREFVSILNNSIIPLFPFSNFLKEQEDLAQKIRGISGAIESASPVRHLQSFSLTFSNNVLNSGVIDWIKNTKNVSTKWAMVYFREIQLWKVATRLDIKSCGVITSVKLRHYALNNFNELGDYAKDASYQDIKRKLQKGSLNPTQHLWRFLYLLNFPFVKKELIRKNPVKLPDVKIIADKL